LAEEIQRAQYGKKIVDHFYLRDRGLDGCLMEGIRPRGDRPCRPSQAVKGGGAKADRNVGQQRLTIDGPVFAAPDKVDQVRVWSKRNWHVIEIGTPNP